MLDAMQESCYSYSGPIYIYKSLPKQRHNKAKTGMPKANPENSSQSSPINPPSFG